MAGAAKKPEDCLPLTATEFQIMLVLAESTLHGYGIMQQIESESNGTIKLGPGTLYTTLKRLVEHAWIEEIDAPPDADDPRRKYYQLTPFGKRVIRLEAHRLSKLVTTAQKLGLVGGTNS